MGPISGAHFNPAVSLVFALRRELPAREAGLYAAAQLAGGVAGTSAAHLMFGLPVFEASANVRTGGAQWFSEGVATFGLVLTILAGIRFRHAAVPGLVGLYITAAYWFTASTSFANPAVAAARALTDTFSGIRPLDLPGFVLAQLAGAVCGMALMGWLLASGRTASSRWRPRRSYDRHDLPQPGLRHVPQHAGDDPRHRHRADRSSNTCETPPSRAELQDLVQPDGRDAARRAAPQGHAL